MIKKLSIVLILSAFLVSSAYAASPSEDRLFRMTFEKIDDHQIELSNLEVVDETPPNDLESSGEYLLELQDSTNQTLYSHNFSFGYEIKGHFGDSGRIRSGELSEVNVIIPYFEEAEYLQVIDHSGDTVLREVIRHRVDIGNQSDTNDPQQSTETEDEDLLNGSVTWILLLAVPAVLLALFYVYRSRP